MRDVHGGPQLICNAEHDHLEEVRMCDIFPLRRRDKYAKASVSSGLAAFSIIFLQVVLISALRVNKLHLHVFQLGCERASTVGRSAAGLRCSRAAVERSLD